MKAFGVLEGVAAPLRVPHLNTDVIIRIERLTALPRDALGPWALEALRYRDDGSEEPTFILNRPPFRDACILLGGENFGCGSSREAAVWALMARGTQCVVAPSFGEIFEANAYENGLLPVRLPEAEVDRLATLASSGEPLRVDLQQQCITAGDHATAFDIDPRRRDALLQGLDSLGLTLRSADRIRAWQAADRERRAWAWAPLAER